MNWKDVINELPEMLREIFYKTWNGEMYICQECGESYPLHELFFRVNSQIKNGFLHTCRKCDVGGFLFGSIVGVVFNRHLKGYRYCNKCKQILPLDAIHFTRQRNDFSTICKKCRGFKNYTETVGGANTKLAKEGLKQCKFCKEIKPITDFLMVGKTRRAEHCQDCEQKRKEEKSIYDQNYFKHNKVKRYKYYQEWKHNGGQEIRRINEAHRQSRKDNTICTLTAEEWDKCKKSFNNKCAYCGKELPLAQEHFIALSVGGEFTLNNILPACQSCNSSKNKKDFFDWYRGYKYYSKAREAKILKYLHYKDKRYQQLALVI